MRICSAARAGDAVRLAIALALMGCAHGAASPPSTAPVEPSGSAAATGTAPASGAARAGAEAAPRTPGSRPDPSEEITPEELASIPEPVPRGASASSPAPTTAPSTASPLTAPRQTAAASEPEPAASGSAWHVQIFASPELAAADSVAKSASALLGAPYAIEFEGALYKVRLGAFASEQDAQALRDRAVRSGFPGAFRVKSESR